MPEALKKALWPVGVTAVLAVAAFLLRNVLVREFVVPTVIAELKRDGVVRDQITEGRFVSTDRMEFAENFPISAELLEELSRSDLSQIAAVKRGLSQIETLERMVSDLSGLAEARKQGFFEVRLYVSEQELDRGFLVLNSENVLVGHLIRDDLLYTVVTGAGFREKRFRTRLEPLTEQEEHTFRAVGRVHRDDFHDLFGGISRVGVARLRLPDDSGR